MIKLWRGEKSLPVAFWIYSVIGNACIYIFYYLWFFLPNYFVFRYHVNVLQNQKIFLSVYIISMMYALFITIAVWRTAGRYHDEILWQDMSRVMVILFFLLHVAWSIYLFLHAKFYFSALL